MERNMNSFNDILRGSLGKHEYGQPSQIRWLSYEKSVRDRGKENMDAIAEIIFEDGRSRAQLHSGTALIHR